MPDIEEEQMKGQIKMGIVPSWDVLPDGSLVISIPHNELMYTVLRFTSEQMAQITKKRLEVLQNLRANSLTIAKTIPRGFKN